MHLIYSKNPKGNFGDDLNPYIFNKIFEDVFSHSGNEEINFYGIGTIIGSHNIICKEIDNNIKNVFFGTGVRNLFFNYDTENWDIRFLRGPISSNVLGLKNKKFITDGAYAYAFLPEYKDILKEEKKYKFSFMPHLSHTEKIDWIKIGNKLDIHIISPHQDVNTSLKEISQSEFIIAGAMHGAIMADVLRVPFVRLRMQAIGSENFLVSDLKWLDWLSSMNLNDSYVYVKNIYLNNKTWKDKIRYMFFIKELYSKLKFIKNHLDVFQLSNDGIFNKKVSQIGLEIDRFKKDYLV